MNNYKNSITLLIKRLLLIVLLYQICRILFYCLNKDLFDTPSFHAFFGGLRFDLCAIAFINLIFIIAHLIPGNFKYNLLYQKILKVIFYIVNLFFISSNFIDFEYYKFTGKRSSFSLITAKGMENEITGLIPSFLKEFWYIGILFILFCYAFWKLIPSLKRNHIIKISTSDFIKQFTILVIVLGIAVVLGRGGTQKKPLRIVDAITYGELKNSALVLNTPFCILKTMGKKTDINQTKFFEEKELLSIYNPAITIQPEGKTIKKNVVIIILESFGDENVGFSNPNTNYTPFLDSLITQSYYFKNGFANGKLSIDAVPSTLSSIPSLMNNSFISSSFSLNKVYGLPKILKEQGYNSSFFHGAFNGSQNFDQYTKIAGFDRYYGKDQYPLNNNKEAFDGKWGIFDEEFLQFFCKELNSFRQPFFSAIFTISSHSPFIIPEKYTNKFPKGTTKIHETIAYTDYALRKFFQQAKKQDWYNNTLFVFTADHASPFGEEEIYKTNIGKFSIPIFFFDSSNPNLKGISEKNLQQIDIMPSILDYLNIKTKLISFGKSYKSKENFVVYYLDNIYHYINDDYYLAFDGTNTIGLYNWKQDRLLKNNLLKTNPNKKEEMERFIKAYIQSFNKRVINNQLTIE